MAFLSTPSGWRATAEPQTQKVVLKISIHALRVEGDSKGRITHENKVISIHALRVEGDSAGRFSRRERFLFLSTPSGWRATHLFSDCPLLIRFLSTPSGWRATTDFEGAPALIFISIHALRVEGDRLTA